MKNTFIALLALSSIAMAAEYTWVGPENGEWNVPSNWDLNNSYYPQSWFDNAIIGDNKTVVWSGGEYYGSCKAITLGQNSTLNLTAGGDINIGTLTIGGGSVVNWTNSYDLGYQHSLTLDFGTFTADSYGSFNISTDRVLWYNGHAVNLVGTLDFAGITPGEGTIALYTLSGGAYQQNIDYSGLQVINANDNVTYEIKQENNGVYISYKAVPEPTTATLSLLALVGLAARRRRK